MPCGKDKKKKKKPEQSIEQNTITALQTYVIETEAEGSQLESLHLSLPCLRVWTKFHNVNFCYGVPLSLAQWRSQHGGERGQSTPPDRKY